MKRCVVCRERRPRWSGRCHFCGDKRMGPARDHARVADAMVRQGFVILPMLNEANNNSKEERND